MSYVLLTCSKIFALMHRNAQRARQHIDREMHCWRLQSHAVAALSEFCLKRKYLFFWDVITEIFNKAMKTHFTKESHILHFFWNWLSILKSRTRIQQEFLRTHFKIHFMEHRSETVIITWPYLNELSIRNLFLCDICNIQFYCWYSHV